MSGTEPAGARAPVERVSITVDGRQLRASKGELLIAAAEREGVYIPRFCYHPRMREVGMCRMCLVEVKGPRGFSLQPACFQHVAEGMEVVTGSPAVKKAQDGVLEFLLVNHPLDCPVCDKGGECPLQDQTLTYGPGESRFVEEKRHWAKPIAISRLVDLDRERCIQCDRCTRFAKEVAGDPFITFLGRGDHTEISTFPDRPFSSYFSGNTVQICPVGALTSAAYRFKARPWDLEQVESTCTTCGFGCRMAVQSSSGRLVRYLGIDVDPVNQGWLCDKGRFGFEAAAAPDRRTQPLVRISGEGGRGTTGTGATEPRSWRQALELVAGRCNEALASRGPASIAVVGGSRLANEDAYAWAKLAKGVIGTDSVDAQLDDGMPAEMVQGLPRATIDDACNASTVLLLGADPREELPVLFLRLRRSLAGGSTKLVECVPAATSLTQLASVSLRYLPGEMASTVSAMVGGKGAGSDPDRRSQLEAASVLLGAAPQSPPSAGDAREAPEQAGELMPGTGVVVLIGRPSLAESSRGITDSAAIVAAALPGARFLPMLRRANLQGALDAGLAPGLLPGRVGLGAGREHYEKVWGAVPAARGLDTAGILAGAAAGTVEVLFLLGADPLSDFPDQDMARAALEGARFVVTVETHPSASSAFADVVLPAAGYGERAGTTTSTESRITALGQKVVPPSLAWPDWMIAAELCDALGSDLGFESLSEIWSEMVDVSPLHRGLGIDPFDSGNRRWGVLVPVPADPQSADPQSADPVSADPVSAAGERGGAEAGKPIDPMAVPGIGSVETQGSASMAGSARSWLDQLPAGIAHSDGRLPPMLCWNGEPSSGPMPKRDGYALRLIAPHRLYDQGTGVQACAALAPLSCRAQVHVNQAELDALGVPAGGAVLVTSAKGRLELVAVADPALPRSVAMVPFNGSGAAVSQLIAAGSEVTEVRIENSRGSR